VFVPERHRRSRNTLAFRRRLRYPLHPGSGAHAAHPSDRAREHHGTIRSPQLDEDEAPPRANEEEGTREEAPRRKAGSARAGTAQQALFGFFV
jgi:hypothetical protein